MGAQAMWLERLSGGVVPIITLESAKDKLRIISPDGDDPQLDAEISRAVLAASTALDVDEDGFGGLGFPLVSQEWVRKGAEFSDKLLHLPFARVRSIEAISCTTVQGDEYELPSEDYVLVGKGRLKAIQVLPGVILPQLSDRPDAVSIRFTAGFPSVEEVPEDIKAAVRELVGFFYDHGLSDAEKGIPEQVQLGIDRLTHRYRAFAL